MSLHTVNGEDRRRQDDTPAEAITSGERAILERQIQRIRYERQQDMRSIVAGAVGLVALTLAAAAFVLAVVR